MPHLTEALATVPIDEQHDDIPLSPTTLRSTLRRRPTALLRFLQTLVTSCMKRQAFESRWIRPDLHRWEPATEILARQHTYLYIRSLSG